MNDHQNFSMTIDGGAVSGSRMIEVVNPATGLVFARAPDCSATELDAAVAAARTAFQAWAAKPLAERQNLVRAMGQILFAHADERLIGLIEDSRAHGHHLLTGGYIPQGQGYFLPPTLVDNPPDDARIVAEEQFGPILPLMRYSSLDDAITRANSGIYGLAASVWGTDLEAAKRVAERLDAGTVWISEAQALSPMVPFAGHRQSGIGVENGLCGILEYTAYKVITVPKNATA